MANTFNTQSNTMVTSVRGTHETVLEWLIIHSITTFPTMAITFVNQTDTMIIR